MSAAPNKKARATVGSTNMSGLPPNIFRQTTEFIGAPVTLYELVKEANPSATHEQIQQVLDEELQETMPGNSQTNGNLNDSDSEEGFGSQRKTTRRYVTRTYLVTPKTMLFNALREGHAMKVRRLILSGVSVNSTDGEMWTALHRASLFSSPNSHKVVELLLSKGANVNAMNDLGWTPLTVAADRGNIKTVQLLLDWGADVTLAGPLKNTPILKAVQKGYLDCAVELMQCGADPKSRNSRGVNCLDEVESLGYPPLVKQLLSDGRALYLATLNTLPVEMRLSPKFRDLRKEMTRPRTALDRRSGGWKFQQLMRQVSTRGLLRPGGALKREMEEFAQLKEFKGQSAPQDSVDHRPKTGSVRPRSLTNSTDHDDFGGSSMGPQKERPRTSAGGRLSSMS